MNLKLIRETFTEKSTIGRLYVDGEFECFILEDKDRGIDQAMSFEKIASIKVPHETCIPYGNYKVIVTKSERFSKEPGHDVYLPLIQSVRGFDGVRIHSGNKPEHTDGCLLTGTGAGNDFVFNSRTAFIILNDKINKALKTEVVWLEIAKIKTDIPRKNAV